MKNIKSIIIYSVIGLFCIAAFSGYFLSSGGSKATMSQRSVEEAQKHIEDVMKKSLSISNTDPVVSIAKGPDYAAATREAVEKAGGLKNVIKKGDTVLLKPNFIRTAAAEEGIITDYRVVQEVANLAKECGAARIIVGEGTPLGNLYSNSPNVFEYKPAKYDQVTGVEWVDFNKFNKEECYFLKHEKNLTGREMPIPKIYMDADVVISIPMLKTHYEGVVTLSLKNSFGVPPTKLMGSSAKTLLHTIGIPQSIIDLNLIRKPDFIVVDGIIGGEGNGPVNASPIKSNVVLAGTDPVAVDTVGAAIMGFTVEEVLHIKLAGQKGLGINDLSKIKIHGVALDSVKMKFKRAASY